MRAEGTWRAHLSDGEMTVAALKLRAVLDLEEHRETGTDRDGPVELEAAFTRSDIIVLPESFRAARQAIRTQFPSARSPE